MSERDRKIYISREMLMAVLHHALPGTFHRETAIVAVEWNEAAKAFVVEVEPAPE